MIKFGVVPTSDRLSSGLTCDNVTEWALRYECFLGDVRLEVDGADFSTNWGWVPVLDFALGICALLEGLQDGCQCVFEFTESEARLEFNRMGQTVELSANYTTGTARVEFQELLESARNLVVRLGSRLGMANPGLTRNLGFRAAMGTVSLR